MSSLQQQQKQQHSNNNRRKENCRQQRKMKWEKCDEKLRSSSSNCSSSNSSSNDFFSVSSLSRNLKIIFNNNNNNNLKNNSTAFQTQQPQQHLQLKSKSKPNATQRDNIKTIQQSKHLSRIRSVCQTPFVITVVVSRFVLIGRIAWVSEILLVCFTLDLYKQFRFSVAVSVFRAFSFRFYSVCQMKIQSRNPKKGSC